MYPDNLKLAFMAALLSSASALVLSSTSEFRSGKLAHILVTLAVRVVIWSSRFG